MVNIRFLITRVIIFLFITTLPTFNFSQQKDSLQNQQDSLQFKRDSFLPSTNSISNYFRFTETTNEEYFFIIVFVLFLIAGFRFIIWLAKKCKRKKEIILIIGTGIIVNIFTALLQSKSYYFSKDTIKLLKQQGNLLNKSDLLLDSIKTVLSILSEVQLGQKEIVVEQKRFANFIMESHLGVNVYKVKDKMQIDTNLIVEIDVLEDKYRWKCKSTDTISSEENEMEEFSVSEIISDYSESQLSNARGLGFICVGSASSEGNPKEEEERAYKRMINLCATFKHIVPDVRDYPIYGLNLGKFMEEGKQTGCSDSTIGQRRVVILKVIYKKAELDQNIDAFSDAVKKILINKAQFNIEFPIDIRKYSMFQNGKLKMKGC